VPQTSLSADQHHHAALYHGSLLHAHGDGHGVCAVPDQVSEGVCDELDCSVELRRVADTDITLVDTIFVTAAFVDTDADAD
jgi:hypothetical protein